MLDNNVCSKVAWTLLFLTSEKVGKKLIEGEKIS